MKQKFMMRKQDVWFKEREEVRIYIEHQIVKLTNPSFQF
jgi:hypothetical protein